MLATGADVAAALQGTPATRTRHTRDGRAVVISAAHPIWSGDEVAGAVVTEETTNSVMSVKSAALDVRTGGRYAIVFSTEDGEEHHVSGVYREVIPNEKLNFTWAWRTMPERESLVTILIKPDGEGSLLTLIHEQFFDEASRDRHEYGWNGCLDKLVLYLG